MHRTQDAPPIQAHPDPTWRTPRGTIGVASLLGAMVFLGTTPRTRGHDGGLAMFIGLLGAMLAIFGLHCLLQLRRGPRLWLHDDGRILLATWTGGQRQRHASDFVGFRLSEHGLLQLLVGRDGQRNEVIPLSTYIDARAVHEWVQGRLPDLDLREPGSADRKPAATDRPGLDAWLIGAGVAALALAFVWMLLPADRTGGLLRGWHWLVVDLVLGLIVALHAVLTVHRRQLTIGLHPGFGRLTTAHIVLPWFALACASIAHSSKELTALTPLSLAIVLPAALALTWLPGAPDITPQRRAFFFLVALACTGALPTALNAGLAPRPALTRHAAHVSEVHPDKNGSHIHLEFDSPLDAASFGADTWVQREPLPVGTRYEVELARGALGWRWVTERRRLDPPGAP